MPDLFKVHLSPDFQPRNLKIWYSDAMEMWRQHEREKDLDKRDDYFQEFRLRSEPLKQLLRLITRSQDAASLWELWKGAGGDTGLFNA